MLFMDEMKGLSGSDKGGDTRGGAQCGGYCREDADEDLDDPAEGFFLHRGGEGLIGYKVLRLLGFEGLEG